MVIETSPFSVTAFVNFVPLLPGTSVQPDGVWIASVASSVKVTGHCVGLVSEGVIVAVGSTVSFLIVFVVFPSTLLVLV